MSKTKIIIRIIEGNVVAVYSTDELEYIVIDEDPESDDPILIGHVNTPDIVDGDLSISSLGGIELVKVAKKEKHPWY